MPESKVRRRLRFSIGQPQLGFKPSLEIPYASEPGQVNLQFPMICIKWASAMPNGRGINNHVETKMIYTFATQFTFALVNQPLHPCPSDLAANPQHRYTKRVLHVER